MESKETLKYSLWLALLPGIGPHMQRKLLSHFESSEDVFLASRKDYLQIKGVGDALSLVLSSNKELKKAEHIIESCESLNIDILCIDDQRYWNRLRGIADIPIILYCKGKIINPIRTCGIVGPRKCNRDTRDLAIEKALQCSAKDCAIISGMATGVDSYAHTAAIKNNSYTIAVLGNGVDICYPKEHIELYEKISESGLLLSAYPPGTKAETYYFPERNKIIAALSDELYVIAPNRNSGSLITANYAKQYNKPVEILFPTNEQFL